MTDRDPTACAVVFEGVEKGFPDRRGVVSPVLDQISLAISPGSSFAILGPSGSGKSTLLRLAAGLETLGPKDRGSVRIGEMPPGDPSIRSALVFQSYSTFPWLTAEQNLGLALRQAGVAKTERREAIRRLLDNVRLREHARQFPDQLSGGQRQRLAFACAIARQPDLLLLDEPMGALDTLTREHLQLELLKLRRLSRPTTVLVTHDLSEAVLLGERVILLSNRPARILLDLDTSAAKPWLSDPEIGAEALEREIETYRRGGTMLSLTNALRDALTQDGSGNGR